MKTYLVTQNPKRVWSEGLPIYFMYEQEGRKKELVAMTHDRGELMKWKAQYEKDAQKELLED